jgi:Icc-related predicted phosphoesterase
MRIAFVGDIHGRVLHLLALLLELQRTGHAIDRVIQVGDFGAYRDREHMDPGARRFVSDDLAELDFVRLRAPDDGLALLLRHARAQLGAPVLFLRGNHEDHAWLADRLREGGSSEVAIDDFDLFHFVADGSVLDLGGVRLAILGGAAGDPFGRIDNTAHAALGALEPGSIDVLVTHDGPYGISVGYHGNTQGSRRLTELVAHLRPRFHVGGHYHNLNGPRRYGETTYLGLSCLVRPASKDRTRRIQPGAVAIFDSTARTLTPLGEAGLPPALYAGASL